MMKLTKDRLESSQLHFDNEEIEQILKNQEIVERLKKRIEENKATPLKERYQEDEDELRMLQEILVG